MRNKFILSVLLLVFAAGLLWSQFWRDFSEKDRKTLGESYWLAGKQYQVVGKTEKGHEYMDLGRRIYPTLDPAKIADEKLPSAAELLAKGRAIVIGAAAGEVPILAIDSFFLRYLGALLDEDPAAISSFLDGSVYLDVIPGEVSRSDAQSQLEALFKEVSLRGLTPSSLYDLESIVVSRAPEAMQDAWGPTYTLRVNARTDYSKYVAFWEIRQQLYIRRSGGDYFIFGIGQTPPPLSWAPQKVGVEVSAPEAAPAAPAEAATSTAITDAFTGCMAALLAKNAEGALAFMNSEITFLRLRQTVTKEELKVSLLGYYEGKDFGTAALSDVLDLDSIFVEAAQSPVDGVTGPVYLLNVKAKVDLSDTIPFWTPFQKYYFLKDAGDWKIFALL